MKELLISVLETCFKNTLFSPVTIEKLQELLGFDKTLIQNDNKVTINDITIEFVLSDSKYIKGINLG